MFLKKQPELLTLTGWVSFLFFMLLAISDKHANFIENFNSASSEDIFILSKIVKDIVMDKFKIELEYEVRVVGF